MTTQGTYYHGTGRRKTASAQVRLYPGSGAIMVNDRPLEDYFPWVEWQNRVLEPFEVSNTLGQFSATVTVQGGGVPGQADAVRLGVARALLSYKEEFRKELRKYGLLTRDPRAKESKKYGLKRARRAPQYTKR